MSNVVMMPKIPGGLYKPHPGSFVYFPVNAKPVVEHCRDRFQASSETFREFFFCHHPGASNNVINFLRTVETIANVQTEDAIILSPTDQNIFTYVKISDWWHQRVRRSFLTALLRAGQNFVEDSGKGFCAALYGYAYTKDTQDAVEWFLSGHNAVKMKKNTPFHGWWALFKQNKQDPRKILVRRKKKEPQDGGTQHQPQEVGGNP